jgi:hypothetical protein
MKLKLPVALAGLLLAGCNPGDDAAERPPPLLTDKFAAGHFLQYFNHQPSLAAGAHVLVVAPAAVGTGTYELVAARDDASNETFAGAWTAAAAPAPADADNPRHAVTLALPGGLAASLTSSVPACLYLLDASGTNILARAGDSDTATDACETGSTAAAFDLPRSRTNDPGYARAYYATIDPAGDRDTLAKFKAANGFGAGDTHVIFRDTKDLGYGRDMYFHDNGGGTYAFYVNNFVVTDLPGQTYGPLNLDAAIEQVSQYHIGTNAIEYGPIDADGDLAFDDVNDDGTVDAADYFPRFYNYSSTPPYERRLTVNLDGKGEKAMPVPCIVCHGGRADVLLPDAVNANPDSRFPRSGDTFSHLQPLDVGTFEYGRESPWTRPQVEVGLKAINTAVYDSYAAFDGPPLGQWDSASAREMLESWYGGAGLPGPFADSYVPAGWQPDPDDGTPPAGADTLYRDVLATNCRTCHLLRGLTHQSDIDFTSWDKFIGYDDRVEELVFDRGLMPLAALTFRNFQDSRPAQELLASFLPDFSHYDGDGALLLPGRPLAKAGPDRTSTNPIAVSGVASLFAQSYQWSLVSLPPLATADLQDADTVRPTLDGSLDGDYVLALVVRNGNRTSAPDTVTVTIDSSLSPAPPELTFTADIEPVLASAGCTACHVPGGSPRPPVFYTDPAGANRDVYDTVRSLVNFEDPENSRLLLKPSGNHHAGGTLTGFDLDGDRSNYDLFLNWILEGAREN